ncbi:hypothetical protein ACFQV8_17995 [Pseudonocardia benzenivorans]
MQAEHRSAAGDQVGGVGTDLGRDQVGEVPPPGTARSCSLSPVTTQNAAPGASRWWRPSPSCPRGAQPNVVSSPVRRASSGRSTAAEASSTGSSQASTASVPSARAARARSASATLVVPSGSQSPAALISTSPSTPTHGSAAGVPSARAGAIPPANGSAPSTRAATATACCQSTTCAPTPPRVAKNVSSRCRDSTRPLPPAPGHGSPTSGNGPSPPVDPPTRCSTHPASPSGPVPAAMRRAGPCRQQAGELQRGVLGRVRDHGVHRAGRVGEDLLEVGAREPGGDQPRGAEGAEAGQDVALARHDRGPGRAGRAVERRPRLGDGDGAPRGLDALLADRVGQHPGHRRRGAVRIAHRVDDDQHGRRHVPGQRVGDRARIGRVEDRQRRTRGPREQVGAVREPGRGDEHHATSPVDPEPLTQPRHLPEQRPGRPGQGGPAERVGGGAPPHARVTVPDP